MLVLVLVLVFVLVLVLVSDGCATAAGPRDLCLRYDGRSLPAPFLPAKVGSADFPLEKGVLCACFYLFRFAARFVSVKSLEKRCNIGKKRPEGESSNQDQLESEQERRKSEPRAACNTFASKTNC